jgi:hypothetical protein
MKKIFSAVIFLFVIVTQVHSQGLPPLSLGKGNDPATQCLERGLVVVKQYLVLEDSAKNQFGQDGKDYFQVRVFVAAKVKSAYWLPAEYFSLTKSDTVIAGVKYNIKTGKTFVSEFGAKASWKEVKGQGDAFKFMLSDASVTDHYKTASVKGGSNLRLILYYYPKDIVSPEVAQLKRSTEIIDTLTFNDQGIAKLPKNISFEVSKVVGGYLFKENISTGMIEYTLIGVYSFNGKDWYVRKFGAATELSPIHPKTHKHPTNTSTAPEGL